MAKYHVTNLEKMLRNLIFNLKYKPNSMFLKTHHCLATIVATGLSLGLNAQTLYTYTNDEDGLPGVVTSGVTASDLSWVNGPVFINACGEGFNSDTWSLSGGPFDTDLSAVELILTPDACTEMTVTGIQFDVRRNPQGPQAMRYAYSTNGGASWIDAGTDFFPDDNPCGSGDTYFWDITDFTTSGSVIFRVYGWDASNVNGQQSMLNGFVYGTTAGTGTTWYADADSDGFGDPSMTTIACDAPTGYVSDNTDCNDANAAINPGAAEICNGLDENCNGDIDEGLTLDTWYADADGDTYGDATVSVSTCDGAPAGYIADNTDCNDADAAINPAATEICGNGIDDNCDGFMEEGMTATATVATASPVCAPLAVTLAADPAEIGNTYQWYRNGSLIAGATDATYDVTALRGYYQVMVSSDFCSNLSDSTYVRIYDPNDPVITTFAGTDLCVNNPIKLKATFGFAPAHSYQWYKDDVAIPGATTAKYNATDAGVYYVNVFAAYPGCSYWSESITLTADCRLDAAVAESHTIDIYPNPNAGVFTIDMNALHNEGTALITIVNMLGEVVATDMVNYSGASIVTDIQLSNIPAGMYTAIVNENGSIAQQQFIIQ